MSLKISFELDDADLEHFRLIMLHARDAASGRAPEAIVATANELLQELGARRRPGFITDRLQKLQMLIEMISDIDWRLPHEEVKRVLNALAYFADPDDLIPDEIPGLGFLDDAIMIELVVRELHHEIAAYESFCAFRTGAGADSSTALADKRDELVAQMRSRRAEDAAADQQDQVRLLD